jgi:hypothetical protein
MEPSQVGSIRTSLGHALPLQVPRLPVDDPQSETATTTQPLLSWRITSPDELVSGGSKEPRGDASTMATQNAHIMFPAPLALREALAEYAQQNNVSAASVARQAIADAIGFDLISTPSAPRTRKYKNELERKEAQKVLQTEKRLRVKAAMIAARKGLKDLTTKLLDGSISINEVREMLNDEKLVKPTVVTNSNVEDEDEDEDDTSDDDVEAEDDDEDTSNDAS